MTRRTDPASPDPDQFHVLAVDLGTGGPKVGLVSMHGTIRWHEHTEVTTRHLPDGGAVQDPEDWWRAVVDSSRRAVAAEVVPAASIVAVCCTGQYASTVPTDARGEPVGDALLWMDDRGRRHARARFGGPVAGYRPRALATWIRRTGGAPSISGADPIGHRLYLAAERPEIHAAARWLLEPIDHLTMRFTGNAAATHASMIVAWLTDNRHLDRLDYDADLVALAGIDPTKLPPLVAPGAVVGTVRDALADQLGLGREVAVIAAVPDLHTAALGSGATTLDQRHLALCTSSWVSAPVTRKRTSLRNQIATVPGLGADQYLVLDNHEVGASALAWLRDRIIAPDDGLNATPAPSFTALIELAARVPPGSGGVVFTPWLNGERSPIEDHLARGAFHNLAITTDRAALVRAVLEGVAYNSRWLLEAVDDLLGTTPDAIHVLGGGAQSDLWCQIHADVLGRTVHQAADPLLVNLRGAALHAAIALGHLHPAEVPERIAPAATFVPDPANQATYDQMYARFPKLFADQRKRFRSLNRAAARRAVDRSAYAPRDHS